jgi:hypothetical protein
MEKNGKKNSAIFFLSRIDPELEKWKHLDEESDGEEEERALKK